jgi:hypothetical protein
MANADLPNGLKPVRDAAGTPFSGSLEMVYIPASDATALFVGDPVVKNGSADAAGVPAAIRAVAAGPISGVVQGFVPDGTTDMVGYRAASTAAYALVCTDPNAMYVIQCNGTFAAADVGLNASMTIATGSATTRRSAVELDLATKATTAALPLKIMGLLQTPNNEVGADAKILVKINNHTDGNAVAGV